MELPETPEGQLPEFLIGDLGPAVRHLARLKNGDYDGSPILPMVYREIEQSLERCITRIKRDVKT